jgi:hypothetical protein
LHVCLFSRKSRFEKKVPPLICLYKIISVSKSTDVPTLVKPPPGQNPQPPHCDITTGVKVTNTSNQFINCNIVGTRKLDGKQTHINDKLPPINPGKKAYKTYVAATPIIPKSEYGPESCGSLQYEFSVLLNPNSSSAIKYGCRRYNLIDDGPW